MRILAVSLLVCMLVPGCARKHSAAAPGLAVPPAGATGTAPARQVVVPRENVLLGKVAKVNPAGRFVVLNFTTGRLPHIDEQLGIYRGGQKVGELKVSGPQLEENVIADLVSGDAAPGDEVR